MYLLINLDFEARQLVLSANHENLEPFLELVTLPVLRQTLEAIKTFINFFMAYLFKICYKSWPAICAMCCFLTADAKTIQANLV